MTGWALLRLPLRSRLLRPSQLPCQHRFAVPSSLALSQRTYATPGRPKSVVGEPSRPVKRAVKKAGAKPASGASTAEKTNRAKKRAAGTQTKSEAAKKAAKAKKASQSTLTPEQKAAKQAKAKAAKDKKALHDLQEAALDPPVVSRPNSFRVYLAEKAKGQGYDKGGKITDALAARTREIVAQYKSLTAAELEHYNHLAVQVNQTQRAEYKHWVESHTVEEIEKANAARRRLQRKLKQDLPERRIFKWSCINDERAVKRPRSAYSQFVTNRNASGDFRNISFVARSKLIAQEWKVLGEEEKQKYTNLESQDRDRYISEYKDVRGVEPSFHMSNGRPQAAAAAA